MHYIRGKRLQNSHIVKMFLKVHLRTVFPTPCVRIQTNIHTYIPNPTKINPLTPNDLQKRRAVSPLKIKIPNKTCVENQIHQLFIWFINYVW
jgi:hypothetical protein